MEMEDDDEEEEQEEKEDDDFEDEFDEEEDEVEEEEEEEVKEPVKFKKEVKVEKSTEKSKSAVVVMDNPEIEKAIRSVLNKVSEGNIEPMFSSLLAVAKHHAKASVPVFAHCYAKIFLQMNIYS